MADPGFLRGVVNLKADVNLLICQIFLKLYEKEEYWTERTCPKLSYVDPPLLVFLPDGFNLTRKSTSQTDNNLLNSDLSYCAAQCGQNVENSIRLPLSDLKDYCTTILNKYVIQRTTNNDPSSHSNKEDSFPKNFFTSTTRLSNTRWKRRTLLAVRGEGPLLHVHGTPILNFKEQIKLKIVPERKGSKVREYVFFILIFISNFYRKNSILYFKV